MSFVCRKDSWQDVQLFVGINLILLILGGVAKVTIFQKYAVSLFMVSIARVA